MQIINRLKQLTARQLPGTTPSLFWHGTASNNLRSILINGLDPSKIKTGNWLVDTNVNELNPSKVSYGGIYYTKSMYTALTYANSLARKDKTGNTHPLLIAVMLQELDTLPDEDQVGFSYLVNEQIGSNEYKAAEIYVNILARAKLRGYNGTFSWFKYIENFRQRVFDKFNIKPENIAKRQDVKRLYGAIDAVLLAGCRRYLAHVQNRGGSKWDDAYSNIKKQLYNYAPKLAKKLTRPRDDGFTELILPGKFRLPTPQQAEQDFIRSADFVIKLLKDYVRRKNLTESFGQKERKIRKLTPVKFKGRNKIVCILELVNDTGLYKSNGPNYDTIQIHYGTLPPEFLINWRERMDSKGPIVWLDKSGKRIGVDNPKNIELTENKDNKSMTIANQLQILTAAVNTVKRKSPIKSKSHYQWHRYGGEPRTINSARHYSVTLNKGHHFGIRPAKSDPEKVRLVHADTGLTKVFTISKNKATRLVKASKPIKI